MSHDIVSVYDNETFNSIVEIPPMKSKKDSIIPPNCVSASVSDPSMK